MALGARSLGSLAAGMFNMRGDSSRFLVIFDKADYDLGSWSKVTGLNVNWKTCDYRHGEGSEIWMAPGLPEYSRITFSRATCPDSESVKEWLAKTAKQPKLYSGQIQLQSWLGIPFVTWELKWFFPTAWKVADLETKQATVVTETLEIAHGGFLDIDVNYANAGTNGTGGFIS